MVQAGLGADYAQQIITTEISDFLTRAEGSAVAPLNLVVRIAFNLNVTTAWFTSVMGIINSITMLAIILARPRARDLGIPAPPAAFPIR